MYFSVSITVYHTLCSKVPRAPLAITTSPAKTGPQKPLGPVKGEPSYELHIMSPACSFGADRAIVLLQNASVPEPESSITR